MANFAYQNASRGVICNPNEDISNTWLPTQPADPANGRFIVRCSDEASPSTQIRIRFNNVKLTVTDSLAYAGLELGTLDASVLSFHKISHAACNLVLVKNGDAGINDAATTVTFGVGTATASNVTLATTMQNVIPVTTVKTTETGSSAGWTSQTGYARAGMSAALWVNSATPKLFFNIGITTGTDIDADAIVTITGELVLNVESIGLNNSTNS